MIKAKHYQFNLPFRHPFTISKGTKTHQPTFIVELEWNGIKGFGEAPAITYYHITVDQMIADLDQKRKFVEQFAFTDPERYWHYLHHLYPRNPFLVCALDMAGWDIFGKLKKKPLHQLWGLEFDKTPMTDYTIGIDSMEKMLAKMEEQPWPIYKIKLGTPDDIGIMKALRKASNAIFRVDANAGWKLDDALQILPVLKDLGVEFVEQPLAKDDWEGMKILFEKSPLPLIADEACVAESDVIKCKDHFHGINIKLTKCSGITPARRMIKQARELDMRVMVGSMNESTIGSAAIGQLLPLLDYVDMDGPLLLSEDIATGLEFENGKVKLSGRPGLGVEFKYR